MAKPSSAHGGVAAPITRRTRSQSAEPVEPVEAVRPASRGGRAPQRVPTADAPVGRPRKIKKGRKPQQKAEPDLTTVEEDADHEDEEVEEGRLLGENGDGFGDIEEPRRVSAAMSVISGTTAKTSFSQEEVELMDADIIPDSLSGLIAAYEDLARLLVPAGKATSPETWKEIRRSGSKPHKLYTNRMKGIEVNRANFGTQNYIQPRFVRKALFGANEAYDEPDALWRPDDILLKVNLIEMINSLLVKIREPGARTTSHVNLLEGLLTAFPDTIAGQEYSLASIEMYANIAAHVAIAKLEASADTDPNFSPYHTIDSIFLDEDDAFVHMAGLGLNSTTDTSRKRALMIIQELIDALKQPFQDENGVSPMAAIGKLKSKFRWDTLIDHALRYYDTRSSLLSDRISHKGGVEHISLELGEEVDRRQEAEALRQKFAKPRSTRRRSLGSMAKLRELEKSTAKETANAPAPQPAQPATGPSLHVPTRSQVEPAVVEPVQVEPVEVEPAMTEAAVAKHTVAKPVVIEPTLSAQTAGFVQALKKSQRPRLLDPQPNATRIDPNFDLDSVASGRERTPSVQPEPRIPGSSRAGKRVRVETEDEEEVPTPTQDEGFETDVRDTSAADRRRREMKYTQAQRTQYRAPSTGAPGPSNYTPSEADQPSPAKKQRKNPGSSIPAPLQPLRPEDDELPSSTMFQRAKTEAKLNRAGGDGHKKPRQREGWLQEEETALCDLIQEHGSDGVRWAEIKSIDRDSENPMLFRRTAEDLRFKARNMKVTMLRTGRGCPENWEHVVLSKKEIDLVHRCGIAYHQEQQRARPFNRDE